MEGLASPILLYTALVLGVIGTAMALPRRGVSPQIIGVLIGAVGLGVLFLALAKGWAAGGINAAARPNVHFYIFSIIAVCSAIRVISHPRPVYAALYFILTIVASSGLYVLLAAEFMAFALVIVYAGAILITYLFVLMLATESPTAEQTEALSEYDRYSREPVMASVVGFILIAAMTGMIFRGTNSPSLPMATTHAGSHRLGELPKKVEQSFRDAGLMDADETIARDPATGKLLISLYPQVVGDGVSGARGAMVKFLPSVTVAYGDGQTRVIDASNPKWPNDLQLGNVENVGFALLADHPGAIEIAGVVLLMAMIGAAVLARKKVEIDDKAKLAAQSRSLAAEFELKNSLLRMDEVEGSQTIRSARSKTAAELASTDGTGGRA